MEGTARHTDRDQRGEHCAGGCTGALAKLRRENLELKQQAGYYRALHRKAVARERRLKERVSGLRTMVRELRQRLRERLARRNNKSEKQVKNGTRDSDKWERGGSSAVPPGPASGNEWAWPARPLTAAGAGGNTRACAERAAL